MVRVLLLAIVVSSASVSADPLDVHVDVDVNVNVAPSDTPVVVRPRWSQEARTWLTVTGGGGPNLSAYRVQLDLARGVLGHNFHGDPIYWVVGSAGTRAFSTSNDFMSDDTLDARDDRLTAYAGLAARVGRLESRWLLGFGAERTVGTLSQSMLRSSVDRFNPVAEIGGEFMVRVVGPVGVVAGGRITTHIQEYAFNIDRSDAWWRTPDAEIYGGVAVLTR